MEKLKCNCQKNSDLDTLELTRDFSPKNNAETTLQLRRNSKAISSSINGKLCYIDSEIHKDYQAAYFCNEYIFQDGNKITAKYCKKRSCLVCSRIMAARLFKAYSIPLLELQDLHMVTLTAPTVQAKDLKKEIAKRYKVITKIRDNFRKTYGIKLKGFRKLEITYNFRSNEYHPHYHILVEGKETAEMIKDYWLKLIPEAGAKGQKVTKVKDSGALFEVFKYVTKAIVKDTFDTKALDTMYTSLKGVRTYQSFGIKKTQEVKIESYESLTISHKTERIDVWKWCKDKNDWYTAEGEQMNSGDVTNDTKHSIKVITKNETLKKRDHTEPQIEYKVNSGFKRPTPAKEGSKRDFKFDG
jgi:Replication protein